MAANQKVETISETTTREAQARISKTARAAAGAAEEMAAATLRPELLSSLIDLFDKTMARAKDAHEKATTIVEHSAEAFEEAFSCANRGSAEYRSKVMEIARANANSAFDLAREIVEAKSLSELFESAVSHQRKQFDAAASQLKNCRC